MHISTGAITSKDFVDKSFSVERRIGYSYIDYKTVLADEPKSFMKAKEWLAQKKQKQNPYTQFISPGVFTKESDTSEVESRYADKPINPNFYGVVNVENLK